ncbi:MAG: hypothetical protein LDLANPLL_00453 [Turneriella sp.]|nr:hypothetical protein [Turneriella sp.]
MATVENDGFFDAIDRYNAFTDNLQVIYRDLQEKIGKILNMQEYNLYTRGVSPRGLMPRIGDYVTLGLSNEEGFSTINITLILNKHIINNPNVLLKPSLIISKTTSKVGKSLNHYDSSILEVIENNLPTKPKKMGQTSIFTSTAKRENDTFTVEFFQVLLVEYNKKSVEEVNEAIISTLKAIG